MAVSNVTPIHAAKPDPVGAGQVLAFVAILALAAVFLSPVLVAVAIWRGVDAGASRLFRRSR